MTTTTTTPTETAVQFATMMRPHIGLAVTDIDKSRAFYRALLDTAPTKERPGYVKFEVAEPPLNLTLNAVDSVPGQIGPAHFGIQVKSTMAVMAATARMTGGGFQTEVQDGVTCCYAVQDKVWAIDPDGHRWEVFVVTGADAAEHSIPAKDSISANDGVSAKNSGVPTVEACCEPAAAADMCCEPEEKAAKAAATGCC